jgi:hypothetical protein
MSRNSPGTAGSPLAARITLPVIVAIALTGTLLSFGRGQLPVRLEAPAETGADEAQPVAGGLSPDLALYRDVIADVRHGRGYYAAARERIPAYGFPIASPLNWRLPTYAWLFSWLPGAIWIQAILIALSLAALAIAFVGEFRSSGPVQTLVVTVLLMGVVGWSVDGHAYLAQEPWAATLLLISVGAYRLAGQQTEDNKFRQPAWVALAIATGLAALCIRELALPYCGIAGCLALYRRRWLEGAAWALGIAAFFCFFAWHVGQVQAQLAESEAAAAGGLSQWLRLGGLDFVLLTTRMNSWLIAAPAWLIWLFLLAALLGLAHRTDDSSRLACLSALAYLLVFAFLGRPENFYWGLMVAPLLPAGTVVAWPVLCELWKRAGSGLTRMTQPKLVS